MWRSELPPPSRASCYARPVTQKETVSPLPRLREVVRGLESVLVCFSGGIDSALLLQIATEELGPRAIGMTAVSASLPEREKVEASAFARSIGADHRIVHSQEIEREGYKANGSDRCFHCKTELYSIAQQKRAEWNLAHVVNGSNLDDLGDYRPGLKAAEEHQVRAPFLEAEMTKADVRSVALEMGLALWDKPAAACLSSRIPYGTAITKERLRQVESLENALKDLGFSQVRVRYHHEVARIELSLDQLPEIFSRNLSAQITRAGKAAGFRYVTFDLEGYRTGSMNELLDGRSLRIVS